jgi:uncharacterized protein (TIGR00255 family)
MTGFGKGTAQQENLVAETEIKSVNSRYLEISLRLPKNLLNKEYEIRELIRNRIKRGKLSVNLQLKKNGLTDNKPVLNQENVQYAMGILKELQIAAGIDEAITLNHLLTFNDIFFVDVEGESEEEYKLILESLNTALDEFSVMRNKEGKELAKDLKVRINNILEAVQNIEVISKTSVQEAFEKVKDRARQLLSDVSAYSERLELELALLVDKADITEEIVRLKSHIKFFLESLEKEMEVGRKLNFICQEINREANTIGSKSLSSEISHHTVFIKEELERIREQIQNIE